jgi:hypothetical protein
VDQRTPSRHGREQQGEQHLLIPGQGNPPGIPIGNACGFSRLYRLRGIAGGTGTLARVPINNDQPTTLPCSCAGLSAHLRR